MADELLLLLGGDLGDPPGLLGAAETGLSRVLGPVVARSRDHWTEAWGFASDRLFLNRALLFATTMPTHEVLTHALAIECSLGRERPASGGPASRTVDIDILLHGAAVINMPDLVVPHPRMHQRAFALAPAADVAPAMRHPLLERDLLHLLNDLRRP